MLCGSRARVDMRFRRKTDGMALLLHNKDGTEKMSLGANFKNFKG